MSRHGSRSAIAVWVAVATVGSAVAFGPALAEALPPGQTFTYTGGEQTYVVPAGVARVDVSAIGAAGGRSCEPALTPGLGGAQTGELAVHGGETLYVEVGGPGGNAMAGCGTGRPGGAGGFNGGGAGGEGAAGGGGGTDVRTITVAAGPFSSLGSRLLTAGGGGGAGGAGFAFGGAGGNAESAGTAGEEGQGGRGATASTFGGGGGGTGEDGQFGIGGAGSVGCSNLDSGSGGGGGGYWGGGSGGPGCAFGGGGGGGGSSFTGGPSVTNAAPPTISSEAASVTIVPAAEASDGLSSGALAFSATTINTISAAQTATLTNTGSVAVDVGSVAITGADESDYLLTDQDCTGSLAPGASCQATVRFAPGAAGQRAATLQFTSNSISSPDAVTLSGTGTPALAVAAVLIPPLAGTSAFKYPYVQVGHGSTIVVIAHLPGPGDFDVLVTCRKPAGTASLPLPGTGRETFAVLHTALANGGRVVEELHPTAQGRKLMRRDARLHKLVGVTVSAIFTPTGGRPNRLNRSFTLKPHH